MAADDPRALRGAVTLSTDGDAPAAAETAGDDRDELPVVDPAHYELGGELAQGGLGRLIRARDRRLGRWVAIKQLRFRSRSTEARFRREAKVTARLQHPAIVPVHEAGRWPNGEPFYAMKLVSGRSLREVIDATRALDERLALLPSLLAVTEAIAYAHSQRVIHRDLKPANIMVGAFGEVVVVDWGLAKDCADAASAGDDARDYGDSASSAANTTHDGAVLGTPAYMPPEQTLSAAVDERADVYALGAVIYHALTGAPPYQGREEILERVRAGDAPPLRRREPGVPDELATIVGKAMARAPEDRYANAGALAEDLGHFLRGKLVGAHHYSRWQLARRWISRNRRAVIVALAAAAIVVVTVAVSFVRVVRARDLAEARRNQLVLAQARSALERDPTLTLAWLKSYVAGGAPDWNAVQTLAVEARSAGVARHVIPDCKRAVLAPDSERVACVSEAGVALWRGGVRERLLPGAATVVRFAGDGTLAFGGEDGGVRILAASDAAAGAPRTLTTLAEPVSALAFDRDGRTIAAAGDRGVITLVDRAGATRTLGTGRAAPLYHLNFSLDGAWLISDGDEGAFVWRLADGTARSLPDPPDSFFITIAPDSASLAWGNVDGAVRVYDLASGRVRLLRGHDHTVSRVDFSPDARRLVSAGQDKTVRLWDLATGEGRVLGSHTGYADEALFSPDGKMVLSSSSEERNKRLWDLETGDCQVLRGQLNALERIQFARDGRTVLTSAIDGETRLWPVVPARERVLRGQPAPYVALAHRADDVLVSAGSDGTVREWDRRRGTSSSRPAPIGPSSWFALSPDARWLLVSDDKLTATDLAGHHTYTIPGGRSAMDLAPDHRHIAAAGEDLTVRVYSLDGSLERSLGQLPSRVEKLAYSPDGRWLAASGFSAVIYLWNVATGERLELRGHQHKVRDFAFSPDGKWLASGGLDHDVRVWDPATGAGRSLAGHRGVVEVVQFSHDSRRVATASNDGTARVWPVAGGEPVVIPLELLVEVLVFSDDDQRLFIPYPDGAVHVFSTTSGAEVDVLRAHQGAITELLVPAGTDWMATAGEDQTIRLWPVDREDGTLRAAELAALSSVELTAEGHAFTPRPR